METKQILKIQPTEQNPLIVENYPYGFKRTKIKYWVESIKRKGDRFCSQTLNPKTNLWNKPKKATYNAVNIVYEDENKHIKYYAFWRSTSAEDYKKFMAFIGDMELNELQKEELRIIRAYIKTYEGVSFECVSVKYRNKTTGEIVEQVPLMNMGNFEEIKNEEKEKEQKEIKNQINKNIAYNYDNDSGSLKNG